MGSKELLKRLRWFFFRDGFLYLLVLAVALMVVDVSRVVQSIKIRKLNDVVTGINMPQLYAFSRGEIPASAVDWERLIQYFRLVIKFFPSREDAVMFLGLCEYYGLGQEENAFVHLRRSANNMPVYFWNVYDTGVLLFSKGDFEHAIPYLEAALFLPGDKAAYAMGNSIIYRQFFKEALNADFELRLNRARENATLLLTAAHYFKKDYDTAAMIAVKGVNWTDISDREPFYFYAGAIAMAKGNSDDALAFFERAMKAKSRNPLVYRYAEDILKKQGRLEEAQRISKMGQALQKGDGLDQFPYPNRLRLEFY